MTPELSKANQQMRALLNSCGQEHSEGKSLLHVVSIFPALTETFVLREARELKRLGWSIFLGQLRPVGRRPTAPGFDDLRPHVTLVDILSIEMPKALLFWVRKRPRQTFEFVTIVLRAARKPWDLLKIAYILLASMQLAYRFRDSKLLHVRGHHLHSEALAAMFIGGFLEIPYSFKCYTVKLYYPKAIISEVVRRSQFVVADTLQVRDFLKALSAKDEQLHLIRNGVHLGEFSYRTTQSVSGPPIILAVGRLDYKKGFHVLLPACALLRDRGAKFQCVIVGDGSERQRLEELREQLQLGKELHMPGKMGFAEIQSWYQRAAMLVVPSVVAPDGSTDGLPTVVTEAFAMGVPLIGTDTAGIPEVIREGTTGFLVPANSAEVLADRIEKLLASEELRNHFATEGHKLAEEVFDLENNSQILSRLILGKQDRAPESVDSSRCATVSLASDRVLE
jgi:glycosyltransferase involved in cell wall biosynthesis